MMKLTQRMAALLLALLLLATAALAEEGTGAAEEASLVEDAGAVEESSAIEAAAEAQDGNEVSGHIAFTEDMAPYAGRWVTFEDGFKLYLPEEWTRVELDEAQQQAGLFYRADNLGSDSAVGETPMGVAVSFMRAGDLTTLDDLVADFGNVGFTELDKLDINGILCISFANVGEDYRGVAFYHATYPNYIMAVYISPNGSDDPTVNDVGSAILCSVSPFAAK